VLVSYVFPSRGRPLELIAAIMMAWQLRSQLHQVEFDISVDEDDDVTGQAMHLMSLNWPDAPIRLFVQKRPGGLGELWNRPLLQLPDAGVVCMMSDRIMPIIPEWDQIVAQCAIAYPKRVLWFNAPGHGQICPALPRAVLDAWPNMEPYDSSYPFWYCDSHAFEIDMLIWGPPALTMPCTINYQRKETQNGRDFEFWAGYFAAMRPKRIAIAKQMAETLGAEWVDRPQLIDEFERQDKFRLSKSEDFAQRFGDKREPDAAYLAIKAKAEAEMQEKEAA